MAFINAATIMANPESKASESAAAVGEIVSLILDFRI